MFVWFPIICFRRLRPIFVFFDKKKIKIPVLFGYRLSLFGACAHCVSLKHCQNAWNQPNLLRFFLLFIPFLSDVFAVCFIIFLSLLSSFRLFLIALHYKCISSSQERADYSFRKRFKMFFVFFFCFWREFYDLRGTKRKRRWFVLEFVARHTQLEKTFWRSVEWFIRSIHYFTLESHV